MTAAGMSCHRETNFGNEVNAEIAFYMFLLLGLIFLFTGITMVFQTRKHFRAFYKEYNCYIWFATIFLAVPLWCRVLFIHLRHHDSKWTRW